MWKRKFLTSKSRNTRIENSDAISFAVVVEFSLTGLLFSSLMLLVPLEDPVFALTRSLLFLAGAPASAHSE